jgi:hypothetical protein
MLLQRMKSLVLPSGSMHKLGTYVVVALIVPGGSLIAFFMLAFRHRTWLASPTWRAVVRIAALGTSLILPS